MTRFKPSLALSFLTLVAVVGCGKKVPVPTEPNSTDLQTLANPSPVMPQGPILLSKDPGFWGFVERTLPRTSGEPFLAAHSLTYITKTKDIDSQVAGISDPNLREAKRSKLWGMIDKVSCEKEAEAAYKVADQAYQVARAAYFAKHTQDWFELGHFKTYRPQEEQVYIEGTKANPLTQVGFVVPLSIQEVDNLFSKFKSVEMDTIASAVNADWNKVTALGGDPVAYYTNNGFSDAEARERIAKEQERLFIRYEEEARSKGLLLVGKIDLKTGKATSLAFMAYNTQQVLMELPGEVVAKVFPGEIGTH